MPLFTPDLLKNRITDITLEDLRALGVRGLLLDVDNTLTTHGSQALDPAVRQWLEAMAEQARADCPVKTGALHASIGVRRESYGASLVAGAPHAACVELGSANAPARPFLYPAFKARAQAMMVRVKRAVCRALGEGGEQA